MSTKDESGNEMIIKGDPTKELFISMLIKDISLTDAVGDLIDNSIDGALRLHPDKKFSGCWVEITINEKQFIIKDNCGGIPSDLAREYAFRFGRDKTMPQTPSSIGQFGIGMKRALFKMGNNFLVNSISMKSCFTVNINVNNWCKKDDWDFNFDSLEEKDIKSNNYGTEIVVSSLKEDVKKQFGNELFLSRLRDEIKFKHSLYLAEGLVIKINNIALKPGYLQLLDSGDFKTAFYKKKFDNSLEAKLYAGIAESDLQKGGWYIFCNDRLIVGPEQTRLTGWGEKKPVRIPVYHQQFNRFRGYAFFNAEHPDMLPWNTSKNNIDIDSIKFKYIRDQMITIMRPVIDFLNDLHDESGEFHRGKITKKVLQNSIEKAELENYFDVKISKTFIYPTRLKRKTRERGMVRISYQKPLSQVKELEKFFKVKSPEKIGELTFDYVYKREREK